jgi:aminoglycoside phosphotransferase (APT) family kinase protein
MSARLDRGVVHGDAWQGNVVVPHRGGRPVLLDLDHVAVGPQEWDLVPIAVDHTDFARISVQEYEKFVDAAGGTDVTSSPAFVVLAAITEIRWTAFTVRKAATDDRFVDEVHHRIRCLRGAVPKPWEWTAA